MLMMVLCDREGRVYDVWITFGPCGRGKAHKDSAGGSYKRDSRKQGQAGNMGCKDCAKALKP